MTVLKWQSRFSTGVAELDAQHQELFRHINDLFRAMLEGRGRSHLEYTLVELIRYAASHFAKEEACMTTFHCPIAAENARAHREFIVKVLAFRERLKAEGPSLNLLITVKGEISEWVSNHMCLVDPQLAGAIEAARAAEAELAALPEDGIHGA